MSFPLLSLAALFLFSSSVLAQPGDDSDYLYDSSQKLKRLDAQIIKTPGDPDLYFERGQIYLHWFTKYWYMVEHRGTVDAVDPGGKALSDFERAIQLDPRGKYFVALGKYYLAVFWKKDSEKGKITAASKWPEIKQRYWDDQLLDTVLGNFRKGVEYGRDSWEKGHALANLQYFYQSRASHMSSDLLSKIIISERQTRSVYDDYDRAIDLALKGILANRPVPGVLSGLVDLYRDKARAAVEFGDHPIGTRSLGEGIKVITDLGGEKEFACYLYVRRGELHTMQKDLTAAMRDYTYAIDSDMVNCLDVYEKRGDIYTGLGDWVGAVKDYTQEMTLFQHPVPRLHAKRGNAHLRAGDAEKAVADLDKALEYSVCGPLYRLRAKARRVLNKNELADEDEKKGLEYSIGRPNDACAFR